MLPTLGELLVRPHFDDFALGHDNYLVSTLQVEENGIEASERNCVIVLGCFASPAVLSEALRPPIIAPSAPSTCNLGKTFATTHLDCR